MSQVNDELFKAGGLFATGRDLLQQGHCAEVRPVVEQVVSLMTVPLVQGTLRYAWKVGQTGGVANKAADRSAKNAAEGSTFAAAVLPMVSYCNAASATTVASHMMFGLVFGTDGAYVSGTLPDFAAVKSAIEDTYACLGITCAHVGGLLDGAAPYAGAEACTHASATIAGYFPGSDVTQHNALDGDQANMQTALKTADFTTATTAYATGGSSTSKGKFRTLKGFSTGAQGKMYDNCPGCPHKHYEQFYDYYGDFNYADKWVSAALAGTDMSFTSGKHGPNNFATLGDVARVEAVQKGSVYMNVWIYAIGEFEDAIDDCTSCTSDCNEHSTNSGSVHAWDEGVAFYTGSLEGTAQGGNDNGAMVYRLAEKRCGNFGTCTLTLTLPLSSALSHPML